MECGKTYGDGRLPLYRRKPEQDAKKTAHAERSLQQSRHTAFYERKTAMLSRLALALLFCTCSAITLAAPAHYWIWQGKDKTFCAQTSPGKGWTRIAGPYVKSDCSM